MSQQLNLLVVKKSGPTPALVSLMILGAVVCALLVVWGVKRNTLQSARAEEVATSAQLKQVSAQLEEKIRARLAALNAEIAALRGKADAAQQVLTMAAAMGRPGGYSQHFSSLAAVREEGVWLTELNVTQAGKALQLSGFALDKDAALRYVHRLNAEFAGEGIKLTSLDLTPQPLGAASVATTAPGGNKIPATVIKFTLH